MAISPININRVSHNLRTLSTLESIRRSNLDLFTQQTRLATGRAFVSISEDPIAASQSLKFHDSLARQDQVLENLRHADVMLGTSDQALTEVNDLLIQAQSLATSSIGALADADERSANAALVAAIRDQLMAVANRQVNDRYVFAGRDTQRTPFVSALGGVAYMGDTGQVLAHVSALEQDAISLPGSEVFGALTAAIGSSIDMSPALADDTRLEDLAGANGQGIHPGAVVIAPDAGSPLIVDLSQADTIGDVVDILNAAAEDAGVSLTISLEGQALQATGATIQDTTGGTTASDLGLLVDPLGPAAAEAGSLRPRIAPNTLVENLNNGDGVDLEGGLRITNGLQVADVDLSEAETVQDLVNRINAAGAFVTARINAAGTGLEIVSRVSGISLSVAENTGTTAADLGLRTMQLTTPLSSLNFGRGVEVDPAGPDLRITTRAGTRFDVDLDTARTVGDVITLINGAATLAGVPVLASLSTTTNGIAIRDNTTGTGQFSVDRASIASFAVDDLGLRKSTTGMGNQIVGDDVGAVRAEGIFTALLDLERTLAGDDDRGISDAGERVVTFSRDVTRVQGILGAKAQTMRSRIDQTENAVAATRELLSGVEDLDYTEAITRFQQAQTTLQASLLSSSQLLNLSLFDYL